MNPATATFVSLPLSLFFLSVNAIWEENILTGWPWVSAHNSTGTYSMKQIDFIWPVKQIHVSVCSLWLINTSQSYTYLFVCILSLRTILVGNLPHACTKAKSGITNNLASFWYRMPTFHEPCQFRMDKIKSCPTFFSIHISEMIAFN